MAPRSKISQLPQDLRDELVDRLLDSGFSNYDAHHQWLIKESESRGIELEGGVPSRAGIGRLGKRQKSISKRMQEVRMMQKQLSSDPLHVNRTTNQMLQLIAYAKTRDAYNGNVEVDADFLKDMALTIGRMEKAAAINEDRERDIREDERKKAQAEAAAKVDAIIESSTGSNSDTIAKLREAIAGGLSA